MALHIEDPNGPFAINLQDPAQFATALGYRETGIRSLVYREMARRGATSSNRADWARAVERYTGNRYTVHQRSYAGLQPLYAAIVLHFSSNPLCLRGHEHCVIANPPDTPLFGAEKPGRALLMSISSAEGFQYRQGHVITILGHDLDEPLVHATAISHQRPRLKVINSFDTRSSNSCTPPRGSVGWLDNYEPRILWYNPDRQIPVYNLAWIERVGH